MTYDDNQSAIETSNILDEKFSDLSFSSNLKDMIGSLEDVSDVDKMK